MVDKLKRFYFSTAHTTPLIVFREQIDLHYLKHIKKINTLCGQDKVSSDVTTNGTFSYHYI